MIQVVQAPCPGCRRVLRIPAEWVHQAMRCKHCGLTLQAKPRSPAAASSAAHADTITAPASIIQPPAPVPAVSPANGAPPAFVFDGQESAGPAPRSRRRGGSGWGKAAVAAVCVLALLGTLGYFAWPELGNRRTGGSRSDEGGVAQDDGKGTDPASAARPNGGGLKEVPADGPFPRRGLVIGVSNYVYANPVSYFVGVRGDE